MLDRPMSPGLAPRHRHGLSFRAKAFASGLALLLVAGTAHAFTLSFSAADFGLNPTFNNVQNFTFSIEVAGPLIPGVYANPELVGVSYQVKGTLSGTPSGFLAFNLVRNIGGAEFYTQGSSLNFEISAGADLTDGLQAFELVGGSSFFVFNGREVGTGRYHPALFELNSDGTGLLRNSNNFGGTNPMTGKTVDVQIGDEYVTELTFDPGTLDLAAPPLCPLTPADCSESAANVILILDRESPGDLVSGSEAKVVFKWKQGALSPGVGIEQDDFGDPTSGDNMHLCFYEDSTEVMRMTAPGGDAWRQASGKGFRYVDLDLSSDGVFKVLLKGGAPGEGKIRVIGKGANLPIPVLPRGGSSSFDVQLHIDGSAECFGMSYDAGGGNADRFRNSDGGVFKLKRTGP